MGSGRPGLMRSDPLLDIGDLFGDDLKRGSASREDHEDLKAAHSPSAETKSQRPSTCVSAEDLRRHMGLACD